jgi:peptidoglycan/xylan/chitin deacetylase (PgdA/CDA1 family)
MSSTRAFCAQVLTGICAKCRMISPPKGMRALMYHAIGSKIPSDTQGRYSLSPSHFAEHMRKLKELRLTVVPLGTPESSQTVAVTFDDGYRDNFTEAYPILSELGIPFTIFVTSDFIRSGDPLYLSPGELSTLANDPLVTIGAHGKTHTPFTALDSPRLRIELLDSRAYLEDLTGLPVITMSYPHGATNARVREAVAEAGFSLAASSRFGCNSEGADLLSLRRTDIWSSDDSAELVRKIKGDWDWLGYLGTNSKDTMDLDMVKEY